MKIIIDLDGNVRSIYADGTAPLLRTLGEVETKRASHVEPEGEVWMADMMPVGGPMIGPFSTRALALEAERRWLLAHDIPEVKE